MTSKSRTTYIALTRNRDAKGHALHPTTQRMIAMRPGTSIDVTPDDGSIIDERNRITSRLRTVRATTDGRYSVYTSKGRLYVARHTEAPPAEES